MNPSAPFIGRPVATTLLTIGVALAGFFAFLRLPVAPLPQVDYPTITVSASMPGASPGRMGCPMMGSEGPAVQADSTWYSERVSFGPRGSSRT